jgi:hypothetical protein
MNKLRLRKLFLLIFILSLAAGSGHAQIFHKNPEKKLFGKTHMNGKSAIVKQPRSVLKAKRKQEANDRRLNKEYDKSIKRSQKRSVDIQTPEVQARMKQNKKDYTTRDKLKKKKVKKSTKEAGEKYN